MRPTAFRTLVLSLTAVSLVACTATPPPPTNTGGNVPPPVSATAAPVDRLSTRATVTIAVGGEGPKLASRLSDSVWASDFNLIANAALTVKDPKGVPQPRLAAEVPSRDRGTWTVGADGTMATTWKIKPNANWHDGRPVVARDFVFAHRVAIDPNIPVPNRRPEQFMDRVEVVDDKTFTIHWNRLYPFADELGPEQLEPLPAHLMLQVYEGSSAETFLAHPFWTSEEYISAGPYRLVRWDRGTQLVWRAFDGYVLGKPKIDEVVYRIISDPQTVVANLLAGEAHTSLGIALGQQSGATLKEQWARNGEGTVIAIPTRYRFMDIQFKPDVMGQPALNDVRVRRAMVLGLDRTTLTEIATAGLAEVTEVFMSPTDEFYQRATQVVRKYTYDVNGALALLREAGWSKQGDTLVNAAGQPFTLDIFSSEGADNELEQGILAAEYRKLGAQVTETVYPRSRQSDREFRAKFSVFNPTALQIEVPETLAFGLTDTCASPNSRWVGNNRGCWSNAEFDRQYQIASTSLDRNERGNAVIEAQRIVNDEVGKIPLSYRTDTIGLRKGLVGPGPRWPGAADVWNIHEWRWE
jgi:peptide/nickel transport system substrate-binding protein